MAKSYEKLMETETYIRWDQTGEEATPWTADPGVKRAWQSWGFPVEGMRAGDRVMGWESRVPSSRISYKPYKNHWQKRGKIVSAQIRSTGRGKGPSTPFESLTAVQRRALIEAPIRIETYGGKSNGGTTIRQQPLPERGRRRFAPMPEDEQLYALLYPGERL